MIWADAYLQMMVVITRSAADVWRVMMAVVGAGVVTATATTGGRSWLVVMVVVGWLVVDRSLTGGGRLIADHHQDGHDYRTRPSRFLQVQYGIDLLKKMV